MKQEIIESTYKEIGDIIGWYAINNTNSHPEDILDKRDKLAVLSYRLAEIVGDAKGNYNSAYFMKVIQVAREKQVLIEKNLAYNKAEVKAIIESEAFFEDAIEKETVSFKNDILLKQLNRVLDAMNQRLSFANKEKRTSDQQR